MYLTRWNPFQEMERFFQTFDTEEQKTVWRPAVDIKETNDSYLIRADLPGVKAEDISIKLENGLLTLRAERKLEKNETNKDNGYHRIERAYGSFQRSFWVPDNGNVENISATHKEGVLEITLPKKPETKPKQIEVTVQ